LLYAMYCEKAAKIVSERSQKEVKVPHEPTLEAIKKVFSFGVLRKHSPAEDHPLFEFWAIGNNLGIALELLSEVKNHDINETIERMQTGDDIGFSLPEELRNKIQQTLEANGVEYV
jgi:hypothetical protein